MRSSRRGSITLEGKQVPTGGLSSYVKRQEIAATLKQWIAGQEVLSERARGAFALG